MEKYSSLVSKQMPINQFDLFLPGDKKINKKQQQGIASLAECQTQISV